MARDEWIGFHSPRLTEPILRHGFREHLPDRDRLQAPSSRFSFSTALSGVVRMVESLGSAHHVHLAVAGLADPLVASLTDRPTGDTLTVSLPRDTLLLFDDAGRAVRKDGGQ